MINQPLFEGKSTLHRKRLQPPYVVNYSLLFPSILLRFVPIVVFNASSTSRALRATSGERPGVGERVMNASEMRTPPAVNITSQSHFLIQIETSLRCEHFYYVQGLPVPFISRTFKTHL